MNNQSSTDLFGFPPQIVNVHEFSQFNFLENNPQELHIMVDIETLDISPTAAITEIGAVVVSHLGTKSLQHTFFSDVIDLHGTTSNSTLNWRRENNLPWVQLKGVESIEETHPLHIKCVMEDFFSWINIQCEKVNARPVMWCKGTDFDKVIIQTAATQRCGNLIFPWDYNKFFDVRTLLYLFPQFKVPKDLVKHNGLDDALLQATALIKLAEHVAKLSALQQLVE